MPDHTHRPARGFTPPARRSRAKAAGPAGPFRRAGSRFAAVRPGVRSGVRSGQSR